MLGRRDDANAHAPIDNMAHSFSYHKSIKSDALNVHWGNEPRTLQRLTTMSRRAEKAASTKKPRDSPRPQPQASALIHTLFLYVVLS